MFDDDQHISFQHQGRVLVVTLSRPAQRNAVNAVNGALHAELARVFVDAQRDPGSDAVPLTGAGTAFCAGGEIDWMQAGIDDPAAFERTSVEGKAVLFSQLELDKPLICAPNGHATGHATGLGASLALVHAHFDAGLADELLSNRSADHAEAVAAVRERRPPRFSGR